MIPSVLSKIALSVRDRMEERKLSQSYADLEKRIARSRHTHCFASAFQKNETSILAEIKFKSPARGTLKAGNIDEAVSIAGEYLDAGAAAISILTEMDHFQGHPDYLRAVRDAFPGACLLMKDFIVDEYQLLEARLNGADCILLIVALLGEERTRELAKFATSLGLSSLVEIHTEEEFKFGLTVECDLLGVNNRDLKTLNVSLETSEALAKWIPNSKVVLSESGITTREEIVRLKSLGYSGFLIGGALMQADAPLKALRALMGQAT